MEKHILLGGHGADVSETPCLNHINVRNVYKSLDNLYTLKESFDFESLDFIYSKNLINSTKFYYILIKEWMNFIKKGGFIVIDFRPNKILNFSLAVYKINKILQDKGFILQKENLKKRSRIIIKKTKKILRKKDNISSWTFGIITNGKNNDAVDKEIESIKRLDIPHHEIIVCGEYTSKIKSKNLKILPFDSTIPWITKKKNLICENAKYENIVITHDRFTFDKNWYIGMKRYGNYFEALSCRIHDPIGRRVDDWITAGAHYNKKYRNRGLLQYRDWDTNLFICGGFYIIKKSVWEKCKWDESLIWGQGEDVILTHEQLRSGIVSRFNPYSSCTTTKKRGDMIKGWFTFKFNKKKFITLKDRPLLRKIKLYLRIIFDKYLS